MDRSALRLGARILFSLPAFVLDWLAGGPHRREGQRLDPVLHIAVFLNELLRPRIDSLSVEKARAEYRRLLSVLGEPRRPMRRIEERSVDGVPIRVYFPETAGSSAGQLVYFHGGGGVIGDLETSDGPCRLLAHRAGCIVISVGYRRAPEHPFPTSLEDGRKVLAWALSDAAPGVTHRTAVGGDSFGALLSALLTQEAAASAKPGPCFQLLFYPLTDFEANGGSRVRFGSGYLLDTALIEWFMGHLFARPEDRADPRYSPLHATRLEGLAPTAILAAGFDPLRDEAVAYAERLRQAGVPVRIRVYDAMVHGFISFAHVTPAADEAMMEAAGWLSEALTPVPGEAPGAST